MGRDLLVENLGWAVGNGQSINVWQDAWLSTSRHMRPMGPLSERSLEMKVSDLMSPTTGSWDVEKVQLHLPDYEDTIRSIKLSLTGAPDRIIWLGTKTGEMRLNQVTITLSTLRNRNRVQQLTGFCPGKKMSGI